MPPESEPGSSALTPAQSATTKPFPQLFWGLVAIAIALGTGSLIGAGAIKSLRSGDTLTVIGSAKRPIRADHVVWRSSVSSQQPTLAQAFQDVKRYSERVQAYFKAQNIPADALTLSAVSTEAIPELVNNNPTGRTLAYRLVQSFEISSPDVDGIAKISRSSTDLINEGIPFVSDPPQYLYTNLSKLRVEMIKEATQDAKERADAIAGVTRSQVGPVRSAETDAFQITARYSTDVSGGGSYDTQTIDKDITAVVSVTFSVD
ncbi:SIMPL domain-containing protein [Thermosynechococcaceae cyanobacterium BACA0444]|uniref:SIMPL domain-containing protein n=1 Tax=Pseudocalidococcus azoricus BACA0444 TaxID=2918990 RepID=A0AAE4FUN2_9CYAN|nr:SIMPL domain-containing protein [Pseudocalidococcus azoricus]MDS3861542.1 SIMPL domain-containing protein [Pseudocalidococcus azoricus BACA0444]